MKRKKIMAYFGMTFWDMKEKKSLGTTIVESDDPKAAITKAANLRLFPLGVEDGKGAVVLSEIPPDKLRYFPIEMFDSLISMEKLLEFTKGSPSSS